ncbi:hypothetical protein BDK51DRAFT_40226 [Blyttiomyces helicus]|uniref:F-box domain-containing protein n=1 Tax=Blyttiomyces helicus TaxID=388810 RepID=A0A4P9WBJ9_9FUNG|nr:hypothetical protein BDK51DRAFT_40226 [Blyttiomyces helicus]|eukprot:RKO89999.1 hypothetical protein BDK51DRAFT_40226 [Blyttiomyces helicus]
MNVGEHCLYGGGHRQGLQEGERGAKGDRSADKWRGGGSKRSDREIKRQQVTNDRALVHPGKLNLLQLKCPAHLQQGQSQRSRGSAQWGPRRELAPARRSRWCSLALASFLLARDSQLRYLGLLWFDAPDPVVIKAIASSAPKINDITITHYQPVFTFENIQFMTDLVRACPRLRSFSPKGGNIPGCDGISAFLNGLGIADDGVDSFDDLFDSHVYAEAGL